MKKLNYLTIIQKQKGFVLELSLTNNNFSHKISQIGKTTL